MVRIRHKLALLVAALALVVTTGACKKDEQKAPARNPEKSVEKADKTQAEKPAETPGASRPMPANANASDLALLPVDAEVVVGLNFQQLQNSMLWKKFAEPKLMSGDVQKKLGEFKDKCGFDPMTAVQTMSLGLKGIGGNGSKPEGAVVIHGPDKGKVMACFEKMKGEATKDGDKIEMDGGIIAITTKDGDKVGFTFINDTTMIGVIGANGTVSGVKTAAAGGSTLSTSASFVEMYSKINTSDSLWLLVNGNSKAFEKAAQMGFKPKAVFGSINVTDGLTVDLRMRLDTPEQATQIAGLAKGQAAQAKSMFDKLDIANEGADIKLSLALSSQKLESLVKQFGSMLGGMGGP